MRVLALEPYYGGSHQAILDGWRNCSRHQWSLLTLPAHRWKWRMRHAPLTFARLLNESSVDVDAIVCSDMLDLAAFRGLAPACFRDKPVVVYFHENQLTYPVRFERERDLHFGFTNITTALAADAVWFNSAFHRDDFVRATDQFCRRMPDFAPTGAPDEIWQKSRVMHPGISLPVPTGSGSSEQPDDGLHIIWAARWEYDKNPDDFFAALKMLDADGIRFRISVLGQRFAETPPVFESAKSSLGHRVVRWGFEPSRDAYLAALADADVFVSTARHEFFGLATVEAMACGVVPLLPRRLAYPELLARSEMLSTRCLYDGSVDGLCDLMRRFSEVYHCPEFETLRDEARTIGSAFGWERRASQYDDALDSDTAMG